MATAENLNISSWYLHPTTPRYDGNNPSSARSGAGHPLATDHFTASRMTMVGAYPRPDTETQTHARHRLLSTEIDYRIPIGVQGGARPLKYDIITAPTGTTLGQLYDDVDHGILELPAASVPASGTYTFTVRVTDQELNTVDLTWNATVDDAAFIYIDNSAVSSGDGTHGSPLKDFQDWFLDDSTDSTYLDKVTVWRTGSGAYNIRGNASSTTNVSVQANSKTPSFIAYPGEAPVWDCATAKILTDTPGGLDDLTVIGMTFQNARQDVNNAHFWWVRGGIQRVCFAENTFKDFGGGGTVGNDNTCPIFISDTGTLKSYILIKNNIFDNIDTKIGGTPTSNGSMFDNYYTQYLVFEGNTAINCDTTYGWWFKGSTQFITVAQNVAVTGNLGRLISMGYGTEAQDTPHDQEVCWNQLVGATGDSGQDIVLWAMSAANSTLSYNSWFDRNTCLNRRVRTQFFTNTTNTPPTPDSELLNTEDNVIISDAVSNHWVASVMNESGNITDTETGNTTTDTSGVLTGAARTANLGLKGHEID